MKHTLVTIALLAVSCSNNLTPAQQTQLTTTGVNLVKDAEAGGLVYLTTGSGAAAALAAGAQVVKNHTPVTSAKQPTTKVTP